MQMARSAQVRIREVHLSEQLVPVWICLGSSAYARLASRTLTIPASEEHIAWQGIQLVNSLGLRRVPLLVMIVGVLQGEAE